MDELNQLTANKIRVPVVIENEVWSSYLLEDGTSVRLKPVLTKVYRMEGQVNQSGDQLYSYEYQLVADFIPKKAE